MMNKYEEALKHIVYCDRNDCGISYLSDAYRNDISALRELVDKATPKKILKSVDENGEPCLPRNHGVCPICGFVVEYSDKHCQECGQRLE